MKKLKYLVLILCFCLFISGCGKKEKAEIPKQTSTPLLMEVSKEGTENKLYLFGSIHAADASLYPLPDYVVDAYKKSDAIAVEFDLIEYTQNLSNQMELLTKFVYANGKTITDDLQKETYENAVEILKQAGLYSVMMEHYQPIMWQTLIENVSLLQTGLKEQYGIDKHFLTLAKEDKKDIIELETAEYQYNILLGFDIDMQVYLLEESIKQYEQSKDTMQTLYDLYQQGDLALLEAFLFQEEEEQNPYLEEYNNVLVTVRNQNMAVSLDQTFQTGKKVFCTVGLAHIIGEGGIADLLEQKGYKVRVVE